MASILDVKKRVGCNGVRVYVVVAVGEDEHQPQVFEVTGQLRCEGPSLGKVRVLIGPQDLQITDMDDHLVAVSGSAGQRLLHPAGLAVPVTCDEDLPGVSIFSWVNVLCNN
jgi:hypothetical protein